jgi:hypothetical protein
MTVITIPVNAENVPEDQRKKSLVRIAIKTGGSIRSEVVSIASGSSEARFEVDGISPVTVAIGPEATSAADLFNKATATAMISTQALAANPVYKVPTITITEPIWRIWLFWCRTFTISGYVYGPDNNPVPSAAVSAFNVDWLWWWSSTSQVGATAITDPTGYFSITFEWCCGWLPWYWWELRDWRLDPVLLDKINPVLALNPQLHVSPPSVRPVLGFTELNPQPLPPGRFGVQDAFNPQPDPPGRSGGRIVAAPVVLSPATLPALRTKLLGSLPRIPEFERFCLWPWCDWWPWLDCSPNIIFRITQSCGGLDNVILQETVWDARMDIPTSLSVNLFADADACTIPPQSGQPEGDCFLFTAACGINAEDIAITCDTTITPPPGGTSILAGLAYTAWTADRPFTSDVFISGQFGTAARADYYEITYRPLQPCPNPVTSPGFTPVPPAALSAFQRTYFDATQPYPFQWFNPTFSPETKPVSGGGSATVYESRQYYETVTNPGDWGNVMFGRSWTANVDGIGRIETAGYFADGQYEFQIVGYTMDADGKTLTLVGPLAGCGKPGPGGLNDNNDFALFVANPISGTDTYPVAKISNLVFTVNGASQALPACGILTVPSGGTLDAMSIYFTASDAEGFLDQYDLTLQWSTNAPVALGGTFAAITPGALIGTTYAAAVGEGATRPFWSGGQYRLDVDLAPLALTRCAYELQLNVYKRNIVDCDIDDYYWLPAYYSFTILFE